MMNLKCLKVLLFVIFPSLAFSQTTWDVCVAEVISAGSCSNGMGVFTPSSLTVYAGDRIRFTTRMELLGGYNGTHDIRFSGSPANNVLLPISTNILSRWTTVTTPPFASTGNFPMECVNGNHCMFAELFSGWPCNGYGITVLPPPLPVELLSFTAENSDHAVILKWATASEINNEGFTLEKSYDSEIWINIAEIRGAGNSNVVTNYSYTDGTPADGPNYYRLKQTDFDGKSQYSEVISQIYGWPVVERTVKAYVADQTLTIFFHSNELKSVCSIYDLSGKQIYSTELMPTEGHTTHTVDVGSFPTGPCLIVVENSLCTMTRKIILTE